MRSMLTFSMSTFLSNSGGNFVALRRFWSTLDAILRIKDRVQLGGKQSDACGEGRFRDGESWSSGGPICGLGIHLRGYVSCSCRYNALSSCHPPLQTSRFPFDVLGWETAKSGLQHQSDGVRKHNANMRCAIGTMSCFTCSRTVYTRSGCSNRTELTCSTCTCCVRTSPPSALS